MRLRAREEMREHESSCLCLYGLQSVFKGFNRIHSSITVVIFPGSACVCVCVAGNAHESEDVFSLAPSNETHVSELCLAFAMGGHV